MVKARMSAAEWEKIKKESGIVESNGEAHRVQEDDEPEPISTPTKKYPQVGQMQAAKGGKPAGEVTEWGSHEGYDASKESFMEKHPTLAKAVDIGKKAAGKVGEFVDEEMVHHGAAERRKPTDEEKKEEKKKTQKKLTGIKKKLQKGLSGEEGEDEKSDEESNEKSKILSRGYTAAYGGQGGIFGSRGYEPAFKSQLGTGSYQPAYKAQMRKPADETESGITQIGGNKKHTKSAVEELMPNTPTIPSQPQQTMTAEPDRFNTQNWQSVGFPNTLPQTARGSLFRPAQPAPQQQVVPMVRQPYQPQPVAQTPMPQRRAPMSGPMPRIGLNLNIPQSQPRPVAPVRAPQHIVQNTQRPAAPMTFMGVTLGEKRKEEPKPITRMGEGYKNTPIYLMNSFYPTASYNPNKDPITKKSIIPKIHATVSPNDFTMFGMRVKNKKN